MADSKRDTKIIELEKKLKAGIVPLNYSETLSRKQPLDINKFKEITQKARSTFLDADLLQQ